MQELGTINHQEQRRTLTLDEETIEMLVEKAATRAIEKMEMRLYAQVGKTFITKFFYVIGLLISALFIYLNANGIIKLPMH